jgi:type IV secretion system protein VirD4
MKWQRAIRLSLWPCGLAAVSWLAGAIFLAFLHLPVAMAKPWTIYQYAWTYGRIPKVRDFLFLSLAFSGCGVGYAIYWFVKAKEPSPHGDAAWAKERHIRKAGLRASKGLLLGKYNDRYLMADGFEHVLCFAPTGAGKGVGIVIPNLLNWNDSAIVHDIKGENFRLTSGFRAAHGQKVFLFDPGNPDGITHCYNPLEFISDKPGLRVDDVQKIAHFLLPDQEFWSNEARSLFLGLVIYLIECGGRIVTLGEVLRTTQGQGDFVEFIKEVLLVAKTKLSPPSFMALNAFVQKPEKERGGVLSTLNSALQLWANPLIDAATARSDFDLRRLKKERMTVYVGVSPNNLQRLKPLLQMFYQQAIDFLTMKEPQLSDEPHGVLFLMDEFTSLGKMEQFEKGIAYFRGYRIRLLTIIQTITQLETCYQRAGMDTFLGNSKIRITYAANDIQTAQHISKLLGTYGADNDSKSDSWKLGLSLEPGSRSESRGKIARALLLPQEILQLPTGQEIVFVESAPPIRADKIRYFQDPNFRHRLLRPVHVPCVQSEMKTVSGMTEEDPSDELTDSEIAKLLDEENAA